MSTPLSPADADQYYKVAVELLSNLIRTKSFSREENLTADILERHMTTCGVKAIRKQNNIWCFNKHYDESKPCLLLNSHHDTVKPNQGYRLDPYKPEIIDGKLHGLGSNDAGGALVSLLITFLHFYDSTDLPINLIFVASAEEEISGKEGIASILDQLPPFWAGIVGEPTEMQLAVAEKGLMVLDCYAIGKSGHAARDTGVNAIYQAMTDIEWFRSYEFERKSKSLGNVKMTVTMIDSGSQHNVVPDKCHFVVDVRSTDAYTNEEIIKHIREAVQCKVDARSTRLRPSGIDENHVLAIAADQLGISKFGSATMSDQALIPYDTVKIGPGKSERSHTADEFIYLQEIKDGIIGYINLCNTIFQELKK